MDKPETTKRCQNCKSILRLARFPLTRVRCPTCNEKSMWMFWIDLTGTMAETEFLEKQNEYLGR